MDAVDPLAAYIAERERRRQRGWWWARVIGVSVAMVLAVIGGAFVVTADGRQAGREHRESQHRMDCALGATTRDC